MPWPPENLSVHLTIHPANAPTTCPYLCVGPGIRVVSQIVATATETRPVTQAEAETSWRQKQSVMVVLAGQVASQITLGGSDLDVHQRLCLQQHWEEQHLRLLRHHLRQPQTEQLREWIVEGQRTSWWGSTKSNVTPVEPSRMAVSEVGWFFWWKVFLTLC